MNKEAYLSGYMDKKAYDASKPSMLQEWQTKRALKDAMERLKEKQYGISSKNAIGSLPRVDIPSTKISEQALADMGFKPSLIAVPERGQSQWTTYRGPDRHHLHKHDATWFMHRDKYLPFQAVLKKVKNKKLREQLDLIFSGVAHVTGEGIPGFYRYIKRSIEDAPTFKDIKDMGSPKYDLVETIKDIL